MAAQPHLRRQLEDAPRAHRGPRVPRAVPRSSPRPAEGRQLWFFPPAVSIARHLRGHERTRRHHRRCPERSLGAQGRFHRRALDAAGDGSRRPAALVGHSERRHLFGETDEQVGRKVAARPSRPGITPLVCVGETLAERDGGRTEQVIVRQVDARARAGALGRVGAGRARLRAGVGDRHRPQRHAGRRGPGPRADPLRAGPQRRVVRVPILYGGSVNQGNVLPCWPAPAGRRAGRWSEP